VAQLVSLCESRAPNPMPKVVKNLCAMLSTASEAAKIITTPPGDGSSATADGGDELSTTCTATSGVLTLDRQQVCSENSFTLATRFLYTLEDDFIVVKRGTIF
jgi:hypothetical protein